MKKKFLGLVVAGIFMAAMPSVASAADVDALVKFDGQGSPAGRFYFPVSQDMRLVTGLSINNPMDQTGKEAGYDLMVGVDMEWPLIGRGELTTGITKTTTDGSDTNMMPIKITKNATYNITKDIKVGLTLELLSVNLDDDVDGGKSIKVLNTIYPVLGTTIRF